MYVDEVSTGSLGGSLVARTTMYGNSGRWISVTTSKTLKLNQGDRVYVRYLGTSSNVNPVRYDSYFSGHLVK